jgi:hypothetical protein
MAFLVSRKGEGEEGREVGGEEGSRERRLEAEHWKALANLSWTATEEA